MRVGKGEGGRGEMRERRKQRVLEEGEVRDVRVRRG